MNTDPPAAVVETNWLLLLAVLGVSGWLGLWAIEALVLFGLADRSMVAVVLARRGVLTLFWVVAGPVLSWLTVRSLEGRRRLVVIAATIVGATFLVTGLEAAWSRLVLNRLGTPFLQWWSARSDGALYTALVFPLLAVAFQRRHAVARLANYQAAQTATLVAAQLHRLDQELQPHFLFNSLGAVAELVHRGRIEAEQAIGHLIALFDRMAGKDDRTIVTVAAEISGLTPYLEIQRLRFGSRLRIEFEMSAAASEALIPALVLQPLVENAVRHGVEPNVHGGWIVVGAAIVDEQILLTVRNGVGPTGPGEELPRRRIGIRNVSERLHHLYGTRATLTMDWGIADVTATITLPRRHDASNLTTPMAPGELISRDPGAILERWHSWRLPAAVMGIVLVGLLGYWSIWGIVLAGGLVGMITALGGWSAIATELLRHLISIGLILGLVRWSLRRRWPIRRTVLVQVAIFAVGLVGLAIAIAASNPEPSARLAAIAALQARATAVAAVLAGGLAWRWQVESLEGHLRVWEGRQQLALASMAQTSQAINPSLVREVLVRLGELVAESPGRADRLAVALARFLRHGVLGSDCATVGADISAALSWLELRHVGWGGAPDLTVDLGPTAIRRSIVPGTITRAVAQIAGTPKSQPGRLLLRLDHSGELALGWEGGAYGRSIQ